MTVLLDFILGCGAYFMGKCIASCLSILCKKNDVSSIPEDESIIFMDDSINSDDEEDIPSITHSSFFFRDSATNDSDSEHSTLIN